MSTIKKWQLLFVYTITLNFKCGLNVELSIRSEKYDIVPSQNWPNSTISFGQLSAVAVDNDGNILVFHRGTHIWDKDSFSPNNTYLHINEGPIDVDTVISINNTTGNYIKSWGRNTFYMPHGLTVDSEQNVWLTDVAMHQVFKFKNETLQLTLGIKFEPGGDDRHFCKPTAVAVLPNGDFFIADGYCNRRIAKYSKTGHKLMQIGRSGMQNLVFFSPSPYSFLVPHALAVVESEKAVCVADREHGRILCFNYLNGSFVVEFKYAAEMGGRLFSLAYSPVEGGKFFVVNGAAVNSEEVAVGGFVVNAKERKVEASFFPEYGPFSTPHDVAVDFAGRSVYVVELKPNKLHRFDVRYKVYSAPRVRPKQSKNIYFIVIFIVIISCIPLLIFIYKKRKGKKYYYKADEDEATVFYKK